MKANKLMIGDWFQTTYPNGKVEFRKVEGVMQNHVVCNNGVTNAINPIPLTTEILEKIGFHKQKWNDLVTEYSYVTDLDKIPQTVIQYYIYSEKIEGVMSLCKIRTKSQYGNGQNDCHICCLYYVHELQHALRLCGLNELADNFKI